MYYVLMYVDILPWNTIGSVTINYTETNSTVQYSTVLIHCNKGSWGFRLSQVLDRHSGYLIAPNLATILSPCQNRSILKTFRNSGYKF